MNRVLWGCKSGAAAVLSIPDGQAENDDIVVGDCASGSRNRIMAAAGSEAVKPDSLQPFGAGGDCEVARMAVFTLQQSAARLSVLSSASTSMAVRERLTRLSAQSAQAARSLTQAREEHDADRHVAYAGAFQRDCDYWTISYRGAVIRLKDCRGLQYLWYLVSHPGHEFLALDLIVRSRGNGTSHVPGTIRNKPIPILDAASKATYKRRLTELREALQEAEAHNDIGRAESARAEIQFLEDELAAGVGLGDRARGVGSTAERARSTATKGIRMAIAKIGAAHPTLGRHFDRTVRTGVFCAYEPADDERPQWQL